MMSTPSPSEPVADAWANHAARDLLNGLADRGVSVTVKAGRLDVRPASKLTEADVAQLRAHKPDLMVWALVCDDRTIDRVLALRRGPSMAPSASVPGHCDVCGDALSGARVSGRCGWCALAGRVYWGAPLTRDVLAWFDVAIVGPHAHAVPGTPARLDLDGVA